MTISDIWKWCEDLHLTFGPSRIFRFSRKSNSIYYSVIGDRCGCLRFTAFFQLHARIELTVGQIRILGGYHRPRQTKVGHPDSRRSRVRPAGPSDDSPGLRTLTGVCQAGSRNGSPPGWTRRRPSQPTADGSSADANAPCLLNIQLSKIEAGGLTMGVSQDRGRGEIRKRDNGYCPHLCGADEFGKDAPGLVGGERGGDDEIVMGGLAAVEADGGDFVFEGGFVRQVRMDAK